MEACIRAIRNPMSEPPNPKFAAQFDSDARRTPVRVAFVTRRTSPQVKAQDDSVVMTYPEGLFRAAVAIEILAIALAAISLIWDAPLAQLADPMHTPNPAKAPWYFLGLQELLHYFPPFVAGVLIPTLVVLALIVIPYFDINIESEGVWLRNRERRLRIFIGVLLAFTAIMLFFHVYAVLIPTLLIAAFMQIGSGGCLAAQPRAAAAYFHRSTAGVHRYHALLPRLRGADPNASDCGFHAAGRGASAGAAGAVPAMAYFQAALFLDHDVVSGAGRHSDGDRDVFPRRGLVVGVALEELNACDRRYKSCGNSSSAIARARSARSA